MSPLDALEGRTDGLIALTGGGEGALARLLAEGQAGRGRCSTGSRRCSPDRLYVELSRRGDPVEQAAEAALIDLAYARDLPLVATNPAAYAERRFPRARTTRCCASPSRARSTATTAIRSSPEAWMKPAADDARSCSPTCPRRSTTRR